MEESATLVNAIVCPCSLSLTNAIGLRQPRIDCVQVDGLLPCEHVFEYVWTLFCACVTVGGSYLTVFDRQQLLCFVQGSEDAV